MKKKAENVVDYVLNMDASFIIVPIFLILAVIAGFMLADILRFE